MPTHNIGRLTVSIGVQLASLKRGLSDAQGQIAKWSNKVGRMGATMMRKVTLPIVAAGGAASLMAAGFDKAMAQSTAIMQGLSTDVHAALERVARDLARKGPQSAQELAQAYYFLSSAGLTATESMDSLAKVARFATAGQVDMANATSLLVGAQQALGLSTTKLTHVSDNLIKANQMADATAAQFAESLANKSGPAMRALGMSIEEGLAVLEVFAQQQIKGAEAGTRFQIVLRDLKEKALANEDAFRRLGVQVFDDTGNFRHMWEIVADLEKALGGLSDRTQQARLTALGFSQKSVAATQTLLGFSQVIKNNYIKQLKAAGATQEVFTKQIDNFSDRMVIVWHNIQDVAISMGHILNPAIQKFAELVENVATWMQSWDDGSKKVLATLLLITAALGPLALALRGIGFIITTLIVPAISVLIASLTFLLAHPLVLLGVAIGSVIAHLTGLDKQLLKSTGLINLFSGAASNMHRQMTQEELLTWKVRNATEAYSAALKRLNDVRMKFGALGGNATTALGEAIITDAENAVTAAQEKLDLLSMQVRDMGKAPAAPAMPGMEAGSMIDDAALGKSTDAMAALNAQMELAQRNVEAVQIKTDDAMARVADWTSWVLDLGSRAADLMMGTFTALSQGIGDAVANAIVYGENLGQALLNVMKQVAAGIISSLIQIGLQYLIGQLMMAAAVAAELATRMAAMAAITYASAYAAIIGPATLVSFFAAPAVAGTYAAGAVATMMAGATTAGAAGAGFGVAGLAEGGIVTSPMLAMVGEAGPEAVIPLGGNLRGGGEIHVHVELDRRELTDIVLENIPQRVRHKLGGIL